MDDQAPAVPAGQIDGLVVRFAKHHIGLACPIVGAGGCNQEVGQSIAIEVARCRDRSTTAVARGFPVDRKPGTPQIG